MRRYLTDRQLAEHYSVSRATIWRWVQQGRLPQPVQISAGTTRFSAEAIDQRDREREAGTEAARKPNAGPKHAVAASSRARRNEP
jgi:prophage regulatory protein